MCVWVCGQPGSRWIVEMWIRYMFCCACRWNEYNIPWQQCKDIARSSFIPFIDICHTHIEKKNFVYATCCCWNGKFRRWLEISLFSTTNKESRFQAQRLLQTRNNQILITVVAYWISSIVALCVPFSSAIFYANLQRVCADSSNTGRNVDINSFWWWD